MRVVYAGTARSAASRVEANYGAREKRQGYRRMPDCQRNPKAVDQSGGLRKSQEKSNTEAEADIDI